jgi:predicted metal-binding membrane protein
MIGALDRTSATAVAALVSAAALGWVGLAGYEPPLGRAWFLAGWALMMAAMMLPSIAPLVLLYRGSRTALAGGYLAVWSVIGLLPLAAMEAEVEPALPVVLALAGIYELSPLKTACLGRCSNVAAFLMAHYRSGPLRLGVEHGVWCIGCCIGLMTVLVLAASMGLVWAAAIGAVVFAQKVLPFGEVSARLTGVVLLAGAIAFALGGGRGIG